MTNFRPALGLALLMLAPQLSAAAPQKVFRCGADGKTYSQTPCKDGYEVNADDQRSPEQRKAAEDNVKREAKMAEKMTREREAREAAAAKQAPTIIGRPALPPKPAASAASAQASKARKKPAIKPPLQP